MGVRCAPAGSGMRVAVCSNACIWGVKSGFPSWLDAKAAAHAAGFIGGDIVACDGGGSLSHERSAAVSTDTEHRHVPGATAQGTGASSALRKGTSPRGVDRRDPTGAWHGGISQAKRALAPAHRHGRGPLTWHRGHAMLANESHPHRPSGA